MRTVSYDPLWKTLVDHHMNKSELRDKAGLAKGTITKMGKNESVTVEVEGEAKTLPFATLAFVKLYFDFDSVE